ncbi:MAG: DUF4157 domain-containing protein, partial [Chitinophagaceae bacterium]
MIFSPVNKTTKAPAAIQQKTAGGSFFRKAGEESFFVQKKGGQFFHTAAQPKLTVSSPDDPQEKEADAVADKVMRMSEPVTPVAVAAEPAVKPVPKEELQRKEEEEELQAKPEPASGVKIQCREEKEAVQAKLSTGECGCSKDRIHPKADIHPCACNGHKQDKNHIALFPSDIMRQRGRGPPVPSDSFAQTLDSSKGTGSALPEGTRDYMESRFSADFSHVRIHSGAQGETLSRAINAQAFAHGNEIYFNSGKFSPDSADGQTLLAHELTHTIQQGASKPFSDSSGQAPSGKPAMQRAENSHAKTGYSSSNRHPGDSPVLKPTISRKVLNDSKFTRVQRIPSLGEVWDATGGKVVGAAEAVGEFAGDVASDVVEWTGEKLEALVNELAPGLLPFLRSDITSTIKDSIAAAIDSMTGGLFSRMQTEGLAAILQQLFGSAMGKIGAAASQTCSAIADIAGQLWSFVKQLTGPALEGFKAMACKIGNFFSSVWNDFALPAWDAIKKFAGSAWTWMVEKANWLWDLTGPVRSAIGAAWNWVCKQFGIAWSGAGSVIDWLKEKASAAWNWVKVAIQPVIGPLKLIGGILVALSPAGPILLIYYGAPYVWDAIKWLAS